MSKNVATYGKCTKERFKFSFDGMKNMKLMEMNPFPNSITIKTKKNE